MCTFLAYPAIIGIILTRVLTVNICVLCLFLQPDLCVLLFCVAANCVVMYVYEAVIAAFLTLTSRPKRRYLLLLAV